MTATSTSTTTPVPTTPAAPATSPSDAAVADAFRSDAAPTSGTPGSVDDALAAIGTRTWTEPVGLHPRGTVVVLVGRGETPEVYERFGRRLSADAYRVVAVDEGEVAADAVIALLADDDLPAPRVLLGSDGGALTAVGVARRGPAGLDGVVLAGLPTASAEPLDWDTEVEARSACPTHRGVLARATRSGLFDAPVARLLVQVPAAAEVAPDEPALGLPLLALHGRADTLSPADAAVVAYRALGADQVVLVTDGRHDILNDVTHRSVAATVVLFLERLRLGADLPLIVEQVPVGTSTGPAPEHP